jgi:hypothetical protein
MLNASCPCIVSTGQARCPVATVRPTTGGATINYCMKTLASAVLLALIITMISGCMTQDSDTTPPPSRSDAGSSPGMTEKTSEGVRSTR